MKDTWGVSHSASVQCQPRAGLWGHSSEQTQTWPPASSGGPQFLVGEHLVIKGSPNYKIRLEPSGKSPGTHAVQT